MQIGLFFHSDSHCGIDMVFGVNGKRIKCHYKDYLGYPHGWKINPRQLYIQSKVSRDRFEELMHKNMIMADDEDDS